MASMITTARNDGNPYGDSCMAAMMRVMIDEAVSKSSKLVNFNIRLPQTIDEIVLLLWCLQKEIQSIVVFLEAVAHVIKTEGDRLTDAR